MAKLKMLKVNIFALKENRKQLLEELQRLSVMQIKTEETPAQGFLREKKESQVQTFERNAQLAQQALDILQRTVPEKKGILSSFCGRREISGDEFSKITNDAQRMLKVSASIIELDKKIAELKSETGKIKTNIAQLEPWEKLDVPFSFEGTKKSAAFIGSLPAAYTADSLSQLLNEDCADIDFEVEIISSSNLQTCIFLICHIDGAQRMGQALRANGFTRPGGAYKSLPKEKIKRLRDRIKQIKTEQDNALKKISSYAGERRSLEGMADYFTVRAEKYRVISDLDQSKHTFMITGFVPEIDRDRLKDSLESVCQCVIEFEDAAPEEAPVLLKNNAFSAPSEPIVEMYAMPSATDVDPTPIMSVFFYFFFGMMFSDAGYGLLLVIGTWFLIKKCKPEDRMYKNLKLFQYCGVSTMIWGIVFGSFFGDAPVAIANTLFGKNWTMPHLIDPITDSITLLIISIGFGLIQILVGLGAKFYVLWRQDKKLDALFDCGFWMLFLTGIAVLAVGMVAVPVLGTVGGVMMIASAVGLVLTQGRDKKGVMKIISGVASLYDVTGYISDLMSYSRLLALGLTTGVMAQVFNTLGLMFGGSWWGIIPMTLVFIIGHLINIGLNALGSYVHTIRLQYVELFSKFYEGGGQKFEPFAFNSKYIRLQEERKQ